MRRPDATPTSPPPATGTRSWAPWRFLVVVLGYSWLLEGVAIVIGRDWATFPTPVLFVAATVGPALVASALVATGWADTNLKALWRRVVDVRSIGPGWYATIVAMAVVPMLAGRLVTAGTSRGWINAGMPIAFAVVGVLAGLAEEPGWRGYGQHSLQQRMPTAAAGLVIGVVWAVWHVPLVFIEGTYQSGLAESGALWPYLVAIVAQSLIYAWLYRATGSLFAAVLFHAALNLAGEMFSVDAAAGFELCVWWLLAATLVVADRRMRTRADAKGDSQTPTTRVRRRRGPARTRRERRGGGRGFAPRTGRGPRAPRPR